MRTFAVDVCSRATSTAATRTHARRFVAITWNQAVATVDAIATGGTVTPNGARCGGATARSLERTRDRT